MKKTTKRNNTTKTAGKAKSTKSARRSRRAPRGTISKVASRVQKAVVNGYVAVRDSSATPVVATGVASVLAGVGGTLLFIRRYT